jgi:hypothetical protein
MSKEQDIINRELKRNPWTRPTLFNRPHWTRRRFFELAGAGVTGSFLPRRYAKAADVSSAGVATKNTAQNVIFILLAGAPSHTDTFDFKVENVALAPANMFNPATFNDILFPAALMPNLANQINDFAIIRSLRSHALVHTLAQTWTQIGRNPAAALADIAPNIGSVVAIEKDKERKTGQIFPPFIALNSNGARGSGYFPSAYGPFKVDALAAGLGNTTHPDSQVTFNNRIRLLQTLDNRSRVTSPLGDDPTDYSDFSASAQSLMYNPVVSQAFGFTPAESARYGTSALGNACLVAAKVLKADQGTRFIQITSNDAWDMHTSIYAAGALPARAKILDTAVATMLADLKTNDLLSRTLVVMAGEFGRTVGPLSSIGGRDHFAQHFAVVAGAGVRGGRTIGRTNAAGSDTDDYGWSLNRYVYTEDIEATILSAMGIDWTTIRRDDPFGRGFEYVPQTGPWNFTPVNELW